MIHRRGLLVGLGSLLGAPAIVPYGRLMRVKAMEVEPLLLDWEWRSVRGLFSDGDISWYEQVVYRHPLLVPLGRG